MRSLVMAAVVLASVTTPAAARTAERYIVVLDDNADVAATADALGGQVRQRWSHALRGYSVQATETQARRIAVDPRVAKVRPNRRYTADEVASWRRHGHQRRAGGRPSPTSGSAWTSSRPARGSCPRTTRTTRPPKP